MNTDKILQTYSNNTKVTGQVLNANEWNDISSATSIAHLKINSILDDIENIEKIILLNPNMSLAELLEQDNVYIIRDIFNISGIIEIPQNCILRFDGGKIVGDNDAAIVLNNTTLDGNVDIENVYISGSCANTILTPQMFGAKPSLNENENNKISHTLAFQNLARVVDNENTISKNIYIPSGHYSINEKIVIISGCKIYGDGENSVIDCYEGRGGIYIGYDSAYAEKCERLECTLAEDANKGATSITLNDVSDIHEDDYLILYDIVDGSFSKSRAYYRMSELIKVRKIEGNTLYLYGALYGDYSTTFGEEDTTSISDAPDYRIVISKFFPQQYLISDISIFSHEHQNSSPETYYTFSVVGHCDSLFKNIHIENRGNKVSAQIGLGINFKVEHCIIRNYARYTGDSYGLNINLSQNFSVSHCTLYGNSHVLATGGNCNYYGINNRNFVYDSLYLEESSDGQIQLDVHANAEYYTFSNIVAPHAKCDTGGINVTIFNCVFYYITATFNMSGFVIRNCEMLAGSSVYLVPSRNLNVPPELRDIVMENNLIHGYNTIDLQNATGLNIPMNKFIFKNNVCKGLRLKSGKIRTAIIEGNIFADRELRFEVDSDNLQVFNNLFENGYMSILDSNEVHGQISGNKIHYNGEDTSRYVVYLNHFFGSFNNNQISSNVVLGALLLSYGNTKVSIYDNIFKLGTKIGAYRIIQATRGTIVTANRNIHNSTHPSIITVDDSISGATTDKYNYVGPTSRFSDTNNIDAIGSTLYVRDSNKLGYFSNGINSDRLLYLSAVADEPSVVSNPFEKDNLYYVTFSRYSKNNIVCFSKTEEIVEEELLRAVLERNSTNQVFKAPDPEEYPYVYVATENTSKVYFSFYENRNASEFDGAAFNVKRKGTSNERPIGNDIYVNFLYFDTDLNKMIYAKAISGNEVTWEVVGSRIETYNYIEKTSDTAFTDVKTTDRIGNPIFVRNQNKLGYISNGKKGNALLSISALADNPTIAQNIFEKDKLYFVAFGRSESFNDVYFSKTLEIVEEELLRVAHERYTENQVFKAPDPEEYPYVYVSTLNHSVVWFKFYENRNASEYDGASFNVKRKGTTAERPIGYDIYEGFVYYDTDLGKQIYAKSINESDVTWEFAGSKLETYNYVAKTATTTFDNVGTVDRVGNPIFVRNQNKLGYISNGQNGAALISVSARANEPAITQNTLEKGKLYFVAFSRSESFNEVYFSKTEEIVEGELLRVARERYTENQVFEAPDPVEYPYIYVKTLNNSIVWFRFYLNRNASEYDGAAFNVNRKSTSTNRPTGYDIYEGFVYFDTTLGKPIWAKTINSAGEVVWVDATGATV